jgi:predicted secreted Zn-dependent protease
MSAALLFYSRGDAEARRFSNTPLRTLREPEEDISRRGRRERRVVERSNLRVSASPREQCNALRAEVFA